MNADEMARVYVTVPADSAPVVVPRSLGDPGVVADAYANWASTLDEPQPAWESLPARVQDGFLQAALALHYNQREPVTSFDLVLLATAAS